MKGEAKEITVPVKEYYNAMRRKQSNRTREAKRKNGEARETEQEEEKNDEIEEEKEED